MTSALALFLAAAAVIVVAGTVLTRCADVIAQHTGLGRMLSGMVFLAAATSLPELAVDFSAVRMGTPDLAVGDLLGSSLMNLLILGVLDLLHYSRGRMLSHTSAAHALSGTMSISLTALAALAIFSGRRLGGASVAGVGVGAWAVLVVFLLGLRLVFFDQKVAAVAAAVDGPSPASSAISSPPQALRGAVIGYVLSAAAILVAGPLLAFAAGRLAEITGLGTTFVGTSFVALCTSLPELVTSLAAVRMGAFDLAVGNVFGSNSFNMVLLVPLDLAHPGPLFAAISPTHVVTCIAAMLVTSVAITGQLYHVERRVRLLEPDAVLIVVLVLGALAMIYYLR